MAKTNRFRIGMVILAIFFIIIITSRVLSTPLEISDIKIEPIDKNTVRINWTTNKETNGGVEIVEPSKVSEILKKEFSCNITGNLIIEGYSGDTFKKYGCAFVIDKNGIPSLVHEGIIYGNCVTDSRYFLCKGSENANSRQHSVIINVLQPNTDYTFKIEADFEPTNGWDQHSERSVNFKMP